MTPEAKAKLAALTKEMAEIVAAGWRAAGRGRGGFGGGGAGGVGGAAGGAGGGGRGGRGGGGGARGRRTRGRTNGHDRGCGGTGWRCGCRRCGRRRRDRRSERAADRRRRWSTVQARFNSLTEMLNVSFAVSDEQRKTLQALPADLQKQMDRVNEGRGRDAARADQGAEGCGDRGEGRRK